MPSLPNRDRRRLRAARALVVFASLAVSLLFAEVYLRATRAYVARQRPQGARGLASLEQGPSLLVEFTPRGKRLVPNADVWIRNHYLSRRDVRIRVNSLGLRGEEVPALRQPGEIRILALGDSITWGDYLPEEETYPARIRAHLERFRPGVPVRVVNGGVGDSGLEEEIHLLEDRGLSVGPDAVVVEFYLNDSRPPWGFPGELGPGGWLRRYSVLADTLISAVRLRGWLARSGPERFAWIGEIERRDWRHDREQFLALASRARYDWGAAWEEASWPSVEKGLDRLRALAQEHRFGVALVAFPVAFQVEAEFVEDSPQRRLSGLARERGFAFLDLLPLLRERRAERLFYDHCHPTAAANDWIGEEIARLLDREVLPREPFGGRIEAPGGSRDRARAFGSARLPARHSSRTRRPSPVPSS